MSAMSSFVRKTFILVIVGWIFFIFFAFSTLRGEGLMHLGSFLNLQVKMIHLPGKILSVVDDRIHSVPHRAKEIEYKIMQCNYQIVEWEFKLYERLTMIVKRVNVLFTARYAF